MAEIYRSERRVITYIGEDTGNVERGIDLAKKFILCSEGLDAHVTPAVAAPVFHKHNIPDKYDPAWPSLQDFLCRPWYTRVWIIPESLHNNNMLMMCGKVAISWDIFTQLNKVMQKRAFGQFLVINPKSERQVGAMGYMAHLRMDWQRPTSLLELLVSS